ncbi:MAG: TonB-dependent receptor [Sideroxydans sp.]|nr:TonB-dependent receptor [Sideroxydans sp.]
MMLNRIVMVAMLLCGTLQAYAAEWVINGSVFEKGTDRALQDAEVTLRGMRDVTTATAADGKFQLLVTEAGEHELVASYGGVSIVRTLHLQEGMAVEPQTFFLRLPEALHEMVVSASRSPDRVSKSVVSGRTLRSIAGSGGDPLAGLHALPGVVAVNGTSAPAIRGSGPGDNAYYVDGMVIGKLFHYGSLSVFNPDLIEDFNLHSAAFAPHYGDVTGAVIDVALRKPRTDRVGGKVNVSMMGADFLVEGPSADDQSFYFAARRSYVDLFIKQIKNQDTTIQVPKYWDYQGKYLWQLNDRNKLGIHLHGASDTVGLSISPTSSLGIHEPVLVGDLSFLDAGASQAVMLDSLFSDAALNTLTLQHKTRDADNHIALAGDLALAQESLLLRDQLRLELAEDHELMVGAELSHVKVSVDASLNNTPCTQFDALCDRTTGTRLTMSERFNTRAWAMSVQDRKRVLDKLTVVAGARYSKEDYLDRSYTEPRIGLEWEWSRDTLLTAGWGKHNQMPSGQQIVRLFGNPGLDHIRADHRVVGITQKLNADWNWKSEAYYKKFSNLVVSDPALNYINAASGKAYGLEFLLKKEETEKLSGWWVLNLAKSQRRNDVTGEAFRFQYDEPVNTTLVGKYKLDEDWSFGLKWNYHSGSPYTPVIGTSGNYPDGRFIPRYAGINSGTLPVYHKLDLRVDRHYVMDHWKLNTYFELNNVYQRKNVAGYSYNADYSSRNPVYTFELPISFGVQGEF